VSRSARVAQQVELTADAVEPFLLGHRGDASFRVKCLATLNLKVGTPGIISDSRRQADRAGVFRGVGGVGLAGYCVVSGRFKIWPCCARGVGVTRHPQTGTAGMPEALRALKCINAL
jgi:hypothetical protein